VMTACCVSSKGKFEKAFYKLSQDHWIVSLKSGIGGFCHLQSFSVLLGQVVTTLDVFF
jgi:hypothetical protein